MPVSWLLIADAEACAVVRAWAEIPVRAVIAASSAIAANAGDSFRARDRHGEAIVLPARGAGFRSRRMFSGESSVW